MAKAIVNMSETDFDKTRKSPKTRYFNMLVKEVNWFKTEDSSVLGVVAFDNTDRNWNIFAFTWAEGSTAELEDMATDVPSHDEAIVRVQKMMSELYEKTHSIPMN